MNKSDINDPASENDVATGKEVIGMADEYYVVDGVVYFSREAAQAARESK